MHYIAGPGHGVRLVANTYLEGTSAKSIAHPQNERPASALQAVLVSRRNSQSVAPETPGSIHEGGELGYSVAHAYGPRSIIRSDRLLRCR